MMNLILIKNNAVGKDHRKPARKKKGHDFKKSSTKLNAKEFVDGYFFCMSSVNRVSDYDATSQFIATGVKKTRARGNDVHELNLTNRQHTTE